MSDDLREIQRESALWMAHKRFVAIVEDGADFVVVEHTADGSTFPATRYPTKRKAAARILQLLQVGAVAPQLYPESIGLGEVDYDE